MSRWAPTKEDIVKLCEGVIEDWWDYQVGHSSDWYTCIHCGASMNDTKGEPEDIKHDKNCPYLIAQDILTGAYDE